MWSLKVVKGAELADHLVAVQALPQPLLRFSIGRDLGNTWTIADRSLALSARHCEIVGTPEGPALRDTSTNGTFVNGASVRMVGEYVLRDGDRFLMGPFEIAVAGPPMPARPARVHSVAAAAAPMSPIISGAAAQRGGDPAAMLAAGGQGQRVGLTEILRAAKPAEDSGVDLTRIRVAPARAPAPGPAAARPSRQATAVAVVDADTLAEVLARGLGVPVQALHGQDLLQLAEQLAAAVRATRLALEHLPPFAPAALPRERP